MHDDQTLQSLVTAAWTRGTAPGITASVRQPGGRVFTTAVGSADLAHTQPLRPDAPMYAYSVTKILLAALIMQAVETGQLTLDTPVQSILPMALPFASITVRQLLNHTAGLPDYGALPSYRAAVRAYPHQPWDAARFLSETLPAAPRVSPGTQWAYSNLGYLLVRLLIERLAAAPLAAVVDARLVQPLHLQQTRLAIDLTATHALTPGYSTQLHPTGQRTDIATQYHPGWVAHGTIITTADELCQLIVALSDGTLLTPASWQAMQVPVNVPVTHPRFQRPAYGLGLMVDAGVAAGQLVGHGGGGPGYSAGAIQRTLPDGTSITSVVLANHDGDEVGLSLALDLVQA